jgi:hypothetical protein
VVVVVAHQYSHKFLFGACKHLCNLVQAIKAEKLQVQSAMSIFSQV